MAISKRLLLVFLAASLPAFGQATGIFSCLGPSGQWVNSGGGGATGNVCTVAPQGNQPSNWAWAGSNQSGVATNQLLAFPNTDTHDANSLIYQTPVSVAAWTTTFSWIPSGEYFAFALQNNTNPAVGGGSSHMIGGAGGESDIFSGMLHKHQP